MGVNKISFGFQYDLSGHTVEKSGREKQSAAQWSAGKLLMGALGRGKTSQTQETKSILGRSNEGKAAEEVTG